MYPEGMHEDYGSLVELLNDRRRFWGYSLALTGNVDDAEDLLQDSIVKALTSIKNLREPKAFESWFFTLMKNEFIDLRRHKRLIPSLNFDTLPDSSVCETQAAIQASEDPEHLLVQILAKQALWAAIKELSEDHAEVVILHYLMDYTVPEIVRMTGEMDGTVRSRVSRARSKLREVLLPMIESDP